MIQRSNHTGIFVNGTVPIMPKICTEIRPGMSKVFTKFVPVTVQSLNKTQYSHWRKYFDYKKTWKNSLAIFLGRNKEKLGKNTKHHLDIISVRTKLVDKRNLQGGCKPIDDILIQLGWIHDDNTKVYTSEEYQEITKNKNQVGTWIVLWKYT